MAPYMAATLWLQSEPYSATPNALIFPRRISVPLISSHLCLAPPSSTSLPLAVLVFSPRLPPVLVIPPPLCMFPPFPLISPSTVWSRGGQHGI